MSTEYSPKKQFQSIAEHRQAWAKAVNDPLLHRAITHAQAQMMWKGFNTEAMVLGANRFIDVLLSLSDEVASREEAEIQHRLVSYEPKPMTQTK